MQTTPRYPAELAFATRQAPDLGGRHDRRSLAFAAAPQWQPVVPTFRHCLVGLLIALAQIVEHTAMAIGRAGWLAPVVVAALAWTAFAGLQG